MSVTLKEYGGFRGPGGSTLGELEAFPGTGLAVLLSLNLAGIAGEKFVVTQDWFERVVVFQDRSSEAENDRAGLAGESSSPDRDRDVEAAIC